MALNINEENFEKEIVKSDIPVLLDFWAPWCGPCKMLSPVVDELSKEYEGKVKIGDSTYTKKGFFYIIALNKESITTEANHKLLYNIAHNNNGQLYYPSQFDLLLKEINKWDDIKSVSYNQKQYIDLHQIYFY